MEKETKIKLLHKCGILVFGYQDEKDLVDSEKILKEKGEEYTLLNPRETSQRFPQYKIEENERAIFVKEAGIIYADRAQQAALQLSKKYGATVLENTRVTSIERSSDSISIKTQQGNEFKVSKLVVTSGPWTNDILSLASLSPLPIQVTNEQAVYFSPKTTVLNHTDTGNMPVFIRVGAKHYYGLPQVSHGLPGIKIGGHISGNWVHPDHRTYEFSPESANAIIRDMLPKFPQVEPKAVHFVRCLYSVTPDEIFIIGLHDEDKRVALAGGFCGAGFKHGSVVGQLLSQLTREEPTVVDLSGFSPNRFNKMAKL